MGYNPAGNTTGSGNITHLATVYYSRKALDILKKKLRFISGTEPDVIPQRQGKTVGGP